MNGQQSKFDGFFKDIFRDLKPVFHWRHPSARAWRQYCMHQTRQVALPMPEELLQWSGDDLKLYYHQLTCVQCARRLAALRTAGQKRMTIRQKLTWRLPQLVPYGALAMLVIAVALWILLPHNTIATSARFVEPGPGGAGA